MGPSAHRGGSAANYLVDMSPPSDLRRIANFNSPLGCGRSGTSVMEPFERMCLGSALTGFVVLVGTILLMFIAG